MCKTGKSIWALLLGVLAWSTVGCEKQAAVWPQYELLDHVVDEGYSTMNHYAYIYGDINEAGLEALLFHLSDSLKAHYRTHLRVKHVEVYIWLFYEREAAELTAAKGEHVGGHFGLLYGRDPNNPYLILNPESWQRVRGGPQVKFGLTEDERIAIFEEIIVASRATEEQIQQQAPTDEAEQVRLRRVLRPQRDSVLAVQHGIAPALVDSIFDESLVSRWGWRWNRTNP